MASFYVGVRLVDEIGIGCLLADTGKERPIGENPAQSFEDRTVVFDLAGDKDMPCGRTPIERVIADIILAQSRGHDPRAKGLSAGKEARRHLNPLEELLKVARTARIEVNAKPIHQNRLRGHAVSAEAGRANEAVLDLDFYRAVPLQLG